LEDEVQQWRKSQDLRAYIQEVERKASRQQISPDERKALTAWIEWARDHAQRLDPLSGEELPTGRV
jgi:L-rhamnose isomerase